MAMAVKSRTVCFFFLVIVLLIIAGCSGGYDAGTGLYDGNGITVSFPAGWEKGKTVPNATLTIENPDGSAQISLFIQKLPENITLKQYLKRVSSNMRRIGAREKDSGPIDMGGYEGGWIQRSLKVGGQPFESIAYYVMRENTVYTIIATTYKESYAKWEPTFDEVAKSIRFND